MNIELFKNNKRLLGLLIKIAIVIIAIVFLYKQIFFKENVENVKQEFLSILEGRKQYFLLSLVIILMFINWSLEAYKWKLLINNLEKVSFIKSLKATFSGITTSVFTPNRVGEFCGRIFHLSKADRIEAALITIFGSYSKYIITVTMGSIGFLFLPFLLIKETSSNYYYFYFPIMFIIIILNLLLYIIYFNTSTLTRLLKKIKHLRRYSKYIDIFHYYNQKELFVVLALSFARYMVFAVQYYVLLKMFGINAPFLIGILMISLIFFTSSVIPTLAWTEIFVRGSVAVSFIGLLSSNNIGIVASSFILWLVNVVIPALIGTVFIFNLKFFRKKNCVNV